MKENLRAETEKLKQSWMRHEAGKLRDYLVAGVEDPRINAQSIFTRHFLLEACGVRGLQALMDQEHRFGTVMNWLLNLFRHSYELEELAIILHGLRLGADNAEGIEIPAYVLQSFNLLPAEVCGLVVPNYIQSCLERATIVSGKLQPERETLDAFRLLWNRAIDRHCGSLPLDIPSPPCPKVFEPACGSANDFRFLHAYGLTRLLDYTGIDLCEKNVINARELFPATTFECGNAFALLAEDKAFDLCFVHDLFEHLSIEGMELAVAEVCRVTRQGICAGFFNMHERNEHVVVPDEDYFWNDLSLERVREAFERSGFSGQAIHVGSFLRERVGCGETHNPNAYTLYLHAAPVV